MRLPTLYQKNSNGKFKIWKIETKDNKIITRYGIENGKMQESVKEVFGKNIGKKNETSNIQQANSEATSLWNKKKDRGGYSETKIAISKKLYPQLANTYKPSRGYLKGIFILMPKLDGMRVLASKENNCVKLTTRTAVDITAVHWDLAKEINNIIENGEILDGELYKHGWNFQRIITAAKTECIDTYELDYHIFDYPKSKYTKDDSAGIRAINIMCLTICKMSRIKIVPYIRVNGLDKDKVKHYHDMFVKNGFEGLIIKKETGRYGWGKRDDNLLKYKEFMDEEYRIVGYKCATGNHSGAITFICHKGKDSKDRTIGSKGYFTVTPKFSISKRKEMYKRGWTFVGKMLTVQYQAKSDDGLPIFPVGKEIRDYE